MSTALVASGSTRGVPEPSSTPAPVGGAPSPAPVGGALSPAPSPPASKGVVAADFASLLEADLSKASPGDKGEGGPASSGERDRHGPPPRLGPKTAASALPSPIHAAAAPLPSGASPLATTTPLLFAPRDEDPPAAAPAESRAAPATHPAPPSSGPAASLPPPIAHVVSRPTAPAIHPGPSPATSTAPDDPTYRQMPLALGPLDRSAVGLPDQGSTGLDPSAIDLPRMADVTPDEAKDGTPTRASRVRAGAGPVEHSGAPGPAVSPSAATRSSHFDPVHVGLPVTEVDSGVKSMTPVTKPTLDVDRAFAGAGARMREAFVSVANHAVIRNASGGEIEVPELGRVVVHAHSLGAGVDVNVNADRAETRAVLHAHAGAIANDLHEADLPLARLTIDRADAGHHSANQPTHDSPFGSSGSSGDRSGSARDSARDPAVVSETADDHAPKIRHPTQGRVRIVL